MCLENLIKLSTTFHTKNFKIKKNQEFHYKVGCCEKIHSQVWQQLQQMNEQRYTERHSTNEQRGKEFSVWF